MPDVFNRIVPVPMRALLAGARRKESALLKLISQLVRQESPTETKTAVDACMAMSVACAQFLGGRVKLHRQRDFGNLLEVRFRPKPAQIAPGLRRGLSSDQVLLLGHLDTVWPLGTLRTMPCRIADGRMYGPGVFDMKAGVAMAFTAVELLIEADLLRR